MKLTTKDAEFLVALRQFMDEKELAIEMRSRGIKRLVLRKNYGDRIEHRFGMSRQGVRWRFQRLFNDIYVSAYVTICWIESNFGTELREKVMAIAQERIELQKEAIESSARSDWRKNKEEMTSGQHED